MTNWKKSIGKAGNAITTVLERAIGKFDRTAVIGLVLLVASFALGAITRNSAYITDQPLSRLPVCDTYVRWLCIPTAYIKIPLGALGWFIINITSALSSAVLFILGVILVRK